MQKGQEQKGQDLKRQDLILNTGARMPLVGLGTWKAEPEKAGAAAQYALSECGYRHLDCAYVYKNEKAIGRALKEVFASGKAAREEVFVTSKLWNNAHAAEEVEAACRTSLRDLQLDYLDLYLMHWGTAVDSREGNWAVDERGRLVTKKVPIRETWEAMEELVRAGLVRAIGVANFTGPMLVDLLSYARVAPAVNQIELHPYNQQARLVEFCQHQNIAVTAYSPLGCGGELLADGAVAAIARGHERTPAQILVRWALERGTIAIPKSVRQERIKSNTNVFDFELSKAEMNALAKLERRQRYVDPWEWTRLPYFD